MCTLFPLIGFVPMSFPIKVFNEATSCFSYHLDGDLGPTLSHAILFTLCYIYPMFLCYVCFKNFKCLSLLFEFQGSMFPLLSLVFEKARKMFQLISL